MRGVFCSAAVATRPPRAQRLRYCSEPAAARSSTSEEVRAGPGRCPPPIVGAGLCSAAAFSYCGFASAEASFLGLERNSGDTGVDAVVRLESGGDLAAAPGSSTLSNTGELVFLAARGASVAPWNWSRCGRMRLAASSERERRRCGGTYALAASAGVGVSAIGLAWLATGVESTGAESTGAGAFAAGAGATGAEAVRLGGSAVAWVGLQPMIVGGVPETAGAPSAARASSASWRSANSTKAEPLDEPSS